MTSEFAKEKVFWTSKMNLRLVKFIEKRPFVWNMSHPKYKFTRHRDKVFAEFAAEYNNEFSAQAVKDRWANIRNSFRHHLKKMKTHSNQEDHKVKWHLWEACQFLNTKRDPTVEATDEDTYLNDKFTKGSKVSMTGSNTDSTYNCNEVADQLLRVFKGVQNDIFGLNQSEHAKIGYAITNKLQSLNSYNAALLSQHIMHILLLYDENNPDNPNNINKIINEKYSFVVLFLEI